MSAESTSDYVAKSLANLRSPARFSKKRSGCRRPYEMQTPSRDSLQNIPVLGNGSGIRSNSLETLAARDRLLDVLHGFPRGGSGGEDLTYPHLLEPGDVVLGDGPPAEDQDVLGLVLL